MQAITCFGSGEGKPGSLMYDAMHEVGKLLADRRITVVTGGYFGAGMEAPSKGAMEAGGTTRGYTYREDWTPNDFLIEVIDCHRMANSIRLPNAAHDLRSCGLLSSDGFIIEAGGGIETYQSLITFIFSAQKFWPQEQVLKRLAILCPESMERTGWNEGMLEQLGSRGILKPDVRELIRIVRTPQLAVAWVLEH